MRLIGKVTKIMAKVGGVSASNGAPWERQEFVITTAETYPKTICFDVRNTALLADVKEGEDVVVDFYLNSREYNGRYYTQASAVGVQKVGGVTVAENAPVGTASDIDNI